MSELRDKISEELYDAGVLDLGDRDYGFHHLRDFDRRHLDQVADRILALLSPPPTMLVPGTYENTAQSRESSPELSTLAAKYLGMSLEEMDASILEREPSDGDRLEQDLERVLSPTAYADIKRLAASVLSQDETKGQE